MNGGNTAAELLLRDRAFFEFRPCAIAAMLRAVLTLVRQLVTGSFLALASSSFSLIRSQFSRLLAPQRSWRMRTRAKPPLRRLPLSVKLSLPFLSPACGSPSGYHVPWSHSFTVPPPYL